MLVGAFSTRLSFSRGLLSLLIVVSLAVGALTAHPGAAAAAVGRVEVDGLADLVVGQPGNVSVVARAGEDIESDATPLRLVVTITNEDGSASDAVTLQHNGQAVAVDEDGRAVIPALDQPPLTIAAQPELASEEGLSVPITVTAPDDLTRVMRVRLMRSNEHGANVVRRAGGDRIGTAVAISQATFPQGASTVYVARADEFADALAAGPAAGLGGSPILLTASAFLPDATAEELVRLAPGRVVVLGGRAAVDEPVLNTIRQRVPSADVVRLAGLDRFTTAAEVALDAFEAPVDRVVIATGRGFADALSGGAAAAHVGAPLLLVEPDAVPRATAEALRTLAPRRIVVLGGVGAISDAVAGQLAGFAPDGMVRLAGPDRYATSAAIAQAMFDPDDVERLLVASGANFPDALAGAPAAAAHGGPLLLTDPTALPGLIGEEITRQDAGTIAVLGGESAVSGDVVSALALLTRDVAPVTNRFQESASTAPTSFAARLPDGGMGGPTAPVSVTSPTTDNPINARPGDRFTVQVRATVTGTYVVDYRVGGGAWRAFPNGTATGPVAPGDVAIPLNAPLDNGVIDLRVSVTPRTRQVIEPVVILGAVRVNLTFPPPLISALVENVASQSQLIAVRPAEGLPDGERLDIDLGSAERAGADYPLTDHVEVLGGTGSAVLEVDRDRVARIVYTAGPGDRVPDAGPTAHPLLTFRIDGIATSDVHESHVGQFFRYDIMHGVQRIFTIGSGPSIASPTVTDVVAGSGHTFQRVTFAMREPLGPFERVEIDLSEAERLAVDYADAFVALEGGDPHGPPGPVLGGVFISAVPDESATLTFVAGPNGVPTVQPEGPTIEVFVGGIAVAPDAVTVSVPFRRLATGEAATTTFSTDRVDLVDVVVSDLQPATVDQVQTIAFTLDGAMGDGNGVGVDLPVSGADITYSGAQATLQSGNGGVGLYTYGAQTYLSYSSLGDASGARIEIRLSGVDTGPGDHSHLVSLYRYDSGSGKSAVFNVGAGAPLAGVRVADLPDDATGVGQPFLFAPTAGLPPGGTVTIDLSSAEAGLVAYDGAEVEAYSYTSTDPGSAALRVDPGVDASIVYTAGGDGLPAGAVVELYVYGHSTEPGKATYDVPFTLGGGGTVTTSFAVRPEPGFAGATASNLEWDTTGQTQQLTVTVSGAVPPGGWLTGYLSGAEAGGGRYGGANVVVTSVTDGGSATAQFWVYPDCCADIGLVAGPAGIPDGATITIEIRGVNTDPVDETHVVDWYREDGGGTARAIFDIGAGSPFIGRPYLSDLVINQADNYQYFSASLTSPVAAGDTLVFDTSGPQAGTVDYREATEYVGDGTVTLGAVTVAPDGTSVTFTAGPAGVPAGSHIGFELQGVATGGTQAIYDVPVTAGPHSTSTTFYVFAGHG